jgi:hypothetical protein
MSQQPWGDVSSFTEVAVSGLSHFTYLFLGAGDGAQGLAYAK